ncbi:MAG: hypothetical protein R3F55_21825 [Alphaproteobacteria bacterium]
MRKRFVGLFGLAVAAIAAASPALALDNVGGGGSRCDCYCETANSGYYGEYDSVGYGCAALENKTCNIENPNTGLIETGRLWGCSPTRPSDQSRANAGVLQDSGVIAPSTPQVFQPLLNGNFRN